MHPRAARVKAALTQDYLAHLGFARQAKLLLDGDTTHVDAEIAAARVALQRYSGWAGERIELRHQVPVVKWSEESAPRPEYWLFLDECGVHPLIAAGDPFPVFCLCGIIVNRDQYAAFDRVWRTWKAKRLGSALVRVHEPDVRRRSRQFHHDDPVEEQAIIDSLGDVLSELDFVCIAGVIDKRALAALHPDGRVDDFLPVSGYLMCVDFVMERFVHFLYHAGGDAQGFVMAESRGLREDAEVHAEFLRLQVEGTQWHSERWFRYQLRPYIEFELKNRNHSGLQVADLVARPIAERVLRPRTTPDRWDVVRTKLYDGGQGRPESYGLKVFPSPAIDPVSGSTLVKAEEDAEASPSTDQQVLVHDKSIL